VWVHGHMCLLQNVEEFLRLHQQQFKDITKAQFNISALCLFLV